MLEVWLRLLGPCRTEIAVSGREIMSVPQLSAMSDSRIAVDLPSVLPGVSEFERELRTVTFTI